MSYCNFFLEHKGYLNSPVILFSENVSNKKCICFRHAKRTTVNPDDVKLLVRKCPKLVRYTQLQLSGYLCLSISYICDVSLTQS